MSIKAEIINIGDELLIGQIVNTNASWMSEQLNLSGIEVFQINMISDSKEHIREALETAASRADLILITGGLGPTKDDITKATLCEDFNSSLVINEEALQTIIAFFRKRGRKMTEENKKQAEVPDNCIPIPNYNGTAPGMWFEKDGKIFVSMPGVPYEMQPMLSDVHIKDN